MPEFVGGNVISEQEFAANLQALLLRTGRQRRLTVGTIVGDIRTKSWPENAIAGQPTRVIFIANVKLREFEGQPILQDVLVSNQAHQLVAGSAADGTPVTVELSGSGTATIIGRAAYQGSLHAVDYYTLADIDGQEMEFTYGLRLLDVDDLDPALLTDLNTWRGGQGLPLFNAGEKYFLDPQVDFHGPTYFPGYIGLLDGGRFISEVFGLVCVEVRTQRDWYDDNVTNPAGDWWYGTPDDFPNQDPWYAEIAEISCGVPAP